MCWSDCVDVQAGHHLYCPHATKSGFLVLGLYFWNLLLNQPVKALASLCIYTASPDPSMLKTQCKEKDAIIAMTDQKMPGQTKRWTSNPTVNPYPTTIFCLENVCSLYLLLIFKCASDLMLKNYHVSKHFDHWSDCSWVHIVCNIGFLRT